MKGLTGAALVGLALAFGPRYSSGLAGVGIGLMLGAAILYLIAGLFE